MGSTWEIEVWGEHGFGSDGHSYKTYWRGESAIQAFYKLWMAKKEGFGCVTLHWRG